MKEPTEMAMACNINIRFIGLPVYAWHYIRDDDTTEFCIGILCFQFFVWCGPSAHRLAHEEGE